jgi:hypothetical protein
LPVDPNLQAEQQQAQNDLIGSLQTQTQGDMASLMARYGQHLAMAGMDGSSGANAVMPMAAPRTAVAR